MIILFVCLLCCFFLVVCWFQIALKNTNNILDDEAYFELAKIKGVHNVNNVKQMKLRAFITDYLPA